MQQEDHWAIYSVLYTEPWVKHGSSHFSRPTADIKLLLFCLERLPSPRRLNARLMQFHATRKRYRM